MSTLHLKILVILLIFLGEALAIYAEIIAAKSNAIKPNYFLQIFLKGFMIIIVGGALLIGGYMLGFKHFKNIWIVTVISITSILIVEPILNYIIFQQLPTRGAIIGLIFGLLGFISAIFL